VTHNNFVNADATATFDRLSSKNMFWLSLILLSLSGAAALLVVTQRGVGVTPDGIVYITAARNFSAGRGLVLNMDGLGDAPLTHHAPLYPFTLGGAGLLGIDPAVAARWFNALLLAANIFLTAVWVNRIRDGRAFWTPLTAAALFLVGGSMLDLHAYALTEPLFLWLALTGFWLLSDHLETAVVWKLLLAALLFALASLTRYAGFALIGAGGLALLLLSQADWRERFKWVVIFGATAVSPLFLWLLRNRLTAGVETGRAFVFHPLSRAHLQQGLDSFASWLLLPLALPGVVKAAVLLAVIGGGLWLTWRQYGRRWPRPLALLLLGGGVYLPFLAVSISFFDANTPLDYRILSPIFVIGLIWLLAAAPRPFQAPSTFRLALALLLLLFLAGQAWPTFGWARQASREGLGFHHRYWQESELMAQVKQLPEESLIYSNGASAVYFLTGRSVSGLPRKIEATTQLTNEQYPAQMAALRGRLAAEQGVVVYLIGVGGGGPAAAAEIAELLALQPQSRLPEGTLYVSR
jgi:4-amino-4-deoxy-L-arabinose transferase-like glycosyltransferase